MCCMFCFLILFLGELCTCNKDVTSAIHFYVINDIASKIYVDYFL